MEYIVCTPHIFRDERGRPVPKQPGERVYIGRKIIAKQLLSQGIITRENLDIPVMNQIPANTGNKRVAMFMYTSNFYSGGRIHLYQMAWTLADMGADVFMVTNAYPKWAKDYPKKENMYFLTEKRQKLPDDIGLILTDGKSACGQMAFQYKKQNKKIPLVVLNFETPNWVSEFHKSSAANMPILKNIFAEADMILCNSEESLKYLHQYTKIECETGVVPPAVNDFAVMTDVDSPLEDADRDTPYVVWSARNSKYKGHNVIINTVMNYDKPLNLVSIGKPISRPSDTKLHKFIQFQRAITDAEKMKLMKEAKAVAAPSLFEGFGMVPSEALSNGTPVVVYDLPVLRQNYGDRLIYAKWNDEKDFAKKLYSTIENGAEVDANDAKKTYGMESMRKNMEKIHYFDKNKLPEIVIKRPKVSANMICYYGATVQEAIASIYDHVDEIFIAYGATTLWKDVAPDNSLDLIKAFSDKENKIKLEVRSEWAHKQQMRAWCEPYVKGSQMLIVDADEIYHNLDKWIASGIEAGCPRWVHFWHNLDYFVYDAPGMLRWGKPHALGGSVHNHFRYSKWDSNTHFTGRKGTSAKRGNRSVTSVNDTLRAVEKCPDTCIYHLGHVLNPTLMKAKHQFYLKRDGADKMRVARMDAWHNWEEKEGITADGMIKKVFFEVPDLVKQAYEKTQMELANAD